MTRWACGTEAWVDRAIAQAIAWCDAELDRSPPGSLRTPGWDPGQGEWATRLANVVSARAMTMHARGIAPSTSTPRLIVSWINQTLDDGTAEIESQGFFDVHDLSAHDAWVGLVESDRDGIGMVAVVPERLVAGVEASFDVLMVETIEWLDPRTMRTPSSLG